MTYNPRDHMIKLPGRKGGPPTDYLPVKERVHWLREEHPDADISTQVIELTDTRCVMLATVSIPGGGSASAIGSEVKAAFPDYIEKADTVALGRALAILGYGIDFSDEFDEAREQADPRDYKSMAPPAEDPKPIAKAPGWPENAKAKAATNGEPPPVLKPGQKATIPDKPATPEQMAALTHMARAKDIHLGQRCIADFGVLPETLSFSQAGKLIAKMGKE